MAGSLTLEVATPERILLRDQVTEVEVPGANGALGILPQHAALLSELGAGELHYTAEGGARKFIAISGGWVEVLPDFVRVLATHAEFTDEIDVRRAEAALKRAQDRLEHPVPDLDVARAVNAMKRAQARLEASKHAAIFCQR
jgi:F-type H+-transporting ATPase subunit epsilon